jgi:hypothetical protein
MAGISAIAGFTNRNGSADHTTGRRRALAGSPRRDLSPDPAGGEVGRRTEVMKSQSFDPDFLVKGDGVS